MEGCLHVTSGCAMKAQIRGSVRQLCFKDADEALPCPTAQGHGRWRHSTGLLPVSVKIWGQPLTKKSTVSLAGSSCCSSELPIWCCCS